MHRDSSTVSYLTCYLADFHFTSLWGPQADHVSPLRPATSPPLHHYPATPISLYASPLFRILLLVSVCLACSLLFGYVGIILSVSSRTGQIMYSRSHPFIHTLSTTIRLHVYHQDTEPGQPDGKRAPTSTKRDHETTENEDGVCNGEHCIPFSMIPSFELQKKAITSTNVQKTVAGGAQLT
jgi:hypothetical protein